MEGKEGRMEVRKEEWKEGRKELSEEGNGTTFRKRKKKR